ncbi:MAG: tetratricopeptide repeat protein, partial [Armatimonadota bacterium]|nr:tetratricopeptide repeat protein [Armatimonadota bacterium]
PCNYNVYLEREMVPVLRYLVIPYWVILGLGMYGFIRGVGRGCRNGISLVGLYILSIFLTLVIFSVSSRFRAPMVPAVGVFGGYGFTQVISGFSKRWFGVLVVCLGLPILISLIPYPVPIITAGGYNNLGVALEKKGRINEAVVQYRRALDVDPNYFSAHINLAGALAEQGKLDEAVVHYQQAILIRPTDPNAHFSLGVLYGEKGLIDDEVREYREAIRLRPNFGEAHNNLAVALYYKGRYDEAWEEVRLSRRYGVSPDASFLKALSEKMPRH